MSKQSIESAWYRQAGGIRKEIAEAYALVEQAWGDPLLAEIAWRSVLESAVCCAPYRGGNARDRRKHRRRVARALMWYAHHAARVGILHRRATRKLLVVGRHL